MLRPVAIVAFVAGLWILAAFAGPIEDGVAAVDRGDYPAALEILQPLADGGDPEAQFFIGRMRELGTGLPKDDAEALRWYRLAAEQKYARAQNALALFYGSGRGVPRDDAEAFNWLRLAADQGLAAAQFNLGIFYAEGRGVAKDEAKAVACFILAADQRHPHAESLLRENLKWLRLAVEAGHPESQFQLAMRHAEGRGVEQDDGAALDLLLRAADRDHFRATSALRQDLRWIRPAAERGRADSQYYLALRYAEGDGVPRDDDEALKWMLRSKEQGHSAAAVAMMNRTWLQRAAERGDLESAYQLAHKLKVGKQDAEAVKWFRKAADSGHAKAQLSLALQYSIGRGVPKDGTEAVKWMLRAAGQGDPEAQYILGGWYVSGIGIEADPAEGVKWLLRSAAQGNRSAAFSLSLAYRYGNGAPQDAAEGLMWLLASETTFDGVEKDRDALTARLAPEAVAEATRRAEEWKKEHPR